VKLIIVQALGNQEQHLLVAATTTDGAVRRRRPGEAVAPACDHTMPAGLFNDAGNATLVADVEAEEPNCCGRSINATSATSSRKCRSWMPGRTT
jgi:hypothetical protein